jgi:uncharacterized phosphosugar-binding protein
MSAIPAGDVAAVMNTYFDTIAAHLARLRDTQGPAVQAVAELVADKVIADELVHVYGPGGHSNLGSQEIFFRAGGLVNVSAILDSGTLLSDGALRSMNVERTPGYGRVVIEDNRLGEGDLLLLVNAYGINAALIDAALTARARHVRIVGISSRRHAEATPTDHPARHPDRHNLHDVVDLHVDTDVPVGDAVLTIEGVTDPVAAISTFANAYILHTIVATAVGIAAAKGFEPTIWRSANAPGGDARNARFIERFRPRVRWL